MNFITYSRLIYVQVQFIAFHRWKDAPDPVAFLRDFHRHMFHVKLSMSVSHNERQKEFFELQHTLDNYVKEHYVLQKMDKSCETIAEEIMSHYSQWLDRNEVILVEVSEDGENGAIVSGGIQ